MTIKIASRNEYWKDLETAAPVADIRPLRARLDTTQDGYLSSAEIAQAPTLFGLTASERADSQVLAALSGQVESALQSATSLPVQKITVQTGLNGPTAPKSITEIGDAMPKLRRELEPFLTRISADGHTISRADFQRAQAAAAAGPSGLTRDEIKFGLDAALAAYVRSFGTQNSSTLAWSDSHVQATVNEVRNNRMSRYHNSGAYLTSGFTRDNGSHHWAVNLKGTTPETLFLISSPRDPMAVDRIEVGSCSVSDYDIDHANIGKIVVAHKNPAGHFEAVAAYRF